METHLTIAYRNLEKCLGYVENGTSDTVTISQDDATKMYVVKLGLGIPGDYYYGRTLSEALAKAAESIEE